MALKIEKWFNNFRGIISLNFLRDLYADLSSLQTIADDSTDIYTKWVGIVNQSGTSAPTATALENTLGGNISWSYIATGRYRGTLSGAFISGQTVFYVHNGVFDTQTAVFYVDDDKIEINTSNFSGTPHNNHFTDVSLEIRVYP